MKKYQLKAFGHTSLEWPGMLHVVVTRLNKSNISYSHPSNKSHEFSSNSFYFMPYYFIMQTSTKSRLRLSVYYQINLTTPCSKTNYFLVQSSLTHTYIYILEDEVHKMK